jgi:DNA-binding GntR family transcriptional regulator
VLRALRGDLVTGGLRPGAVYSAPALAERYGVSATPVREAMQALAAEGAVEALPNRGFRVAEHTARDRAELAEVRALVEVPTLLRLARATGGVDTAALRPLAEATVAAAQRADRAAYAEADAAFHAALLAQAGNARLVAVAADLLRRAQWPVPYPGSFGAPPPRPLTDHARDHATLLDALADQDTARVEAVARRHLGCG